MTERTDIRQQGYTERQENRLNAANEYHNNSGGYYHHDDYHHNDGDWDDGEVAAVAIGAAAIGAMAGYAAGESNTSQAPATSTTVVYTTPPPAGNGGLPCTPNTAVVNGVTYFQCGSSWYTEAYGANGVVYMPVPAPR